MTAASILIIGGSGVFGRRLAAELLATTDWSIVLAGRRERALRKAVRRLGRDPRLATRVLDLSEPLALEAAARGHVAVACTAGPFGALSRELPAAAVRAGAHWLDISDDREWVTDMLSDAALDDAAQAGGLAVATGCSSVPAISGILARRCRELCPSGSEATITLYIGNRNAKGIASVRRAIDAGTRDGEAVELPFGTRTAYRFQSPDTSLLAEELQLEAAFRVAFQARLGYVLMSHVGGPESAGCFAFLGRPIGWIGDRRGCLQVELWGDRDQRVAAWVIGRNQRMPVLPLAIVLRQLVNGERRERGVIRVWESPSPEEWLAALAERGLEVGQSR